MKKYLSFCLLSLVGAKAVAATLSNAGDSIMLNRQKKAPTVQYGVASFYHNKFEGRHMANGDIFHQQNMTAASNRLPLNCWAKVTNLRNKKSVMVKITDRMHHLNTRTIDLSRAAAKLLGYTGHGLARVKVEYMGKKKPPEAGVTELTHK